MSILTMLPKFLFLFFIFFYLVETKKESYFKAIRNKGFDNKLLLQNQIASKYAASTISCIQFCADDQNCLSFNYNKWSSTCVLFDQDFIDVATTATQTENGWLYYYLIRDYDKSLRYRCTSTIPTSGICSLFCFHYFYDISHVYAVHASKCAGLDGGEMVRIDRGLKQHCVEKFLGNPLVTPKVPFVDIQGRKASGTANWMFDDGTEITSIPWESGQPNDAAPSYIVLSTTNFRWYDATLTWSKTEGHAVVCQQN